MSELRQKTRHFERRTSELRRKIIGLHKARDRLAASLRHLNWQHEYGTLDYSTYSRLFDEHLNYRNVEDYETWFYNEEVRLRKKLTHYESRLEQVRTKQTAKHRTVAASVSLMLVLAIMLGAMSHTGVLPTEQVATGMSTGIDRITGFATATSTITTNATIEVYFAVAASANLTDGISFTNLAHNTTDNNATENYNGSDMTGFYLALSSDSNVNTDICVKADDDFTTSDGDILEIANLTISNSTVNNATVPTMVTNETLSKTSWTNTTLNLGTGSTAFYRFFLDVPDAQRSGTYNNTISFNIVQNGKNCSITS